MRLRALSHLLLSGSQSVGELARLLHISNTYASQLTSTLVHEGFVVKERTGKRVVVSPNMESPFVQNFSRFVVIVGAYPPHTPLDFLEPRSRRKVIWQLKDRKKNMDELRRDTGYSRTAIYDALKPFLRTGVVSVSSGKKKVYSINKASPLKEPILQLVEFFESDIDLRPLLERISSDDRVIAVSVFGSQIVGRRDRLSDVDALVVVSSPEHRGIAREYTHPRLELSVYSRKGVVQLVRREPWFLRLVFDGRILKGRDFLESLERLPTATDFGETIVETRGILDGLDELPDREKAKVIMYCIRTAVAMRLFTDERLSQERFVDELYRRYPEFSRYREYEEGGEMGASTIRKSRTKILKDLEYVEKKKEKER